MNAQRLTKEEETAVCEMYLEGWSTYKLSFLFQRRQAFIKRILLRYKVHIRTLKEVWTDARRRKDIPSTPRAYLGPNYQGYTYEFSVTPSSGGKKLQKFILERDNYKCGDCVLSCKGRKRMFDRHHINFDLTDHRFENLILLCPSCHRIRHVKHDVELQKGV